MVDTKETINEFTKSSLTYEGYLTILSGTAPNQKYTKLDQLMELEIDTDMQIVSHYNSQKQLHNVVVGSNSVCVIDLKDTVDLYQKDGDTVIPYLLTDMIKELQTELRVVPIEFVGIQKSESTTNPDFIIETLECDAVAVRKRRNLNTGDYTNVIFCIVKKRTPTAADASPEPA